MTDEDSNPITRNMRQLDEENMEILDSRDKAVVADQIRLMNSEIERARKAITGYDKMAREISYTALAAAGMALTLAFVALIVALQP